MKQITYSDLQELKDYQLIDVREIEEHEAFNIGGELMPLSEIMRSVNKISIDKPVVIYCKKGIRSQIAIQRLSMRCPDAEFYNLTNGIFALIKQ